MKKALITGASEGIGRAFALRLAETGFYVTAVARNKARLEELLEELPQGDHSFIVADLSTAGGVKKVATELSRNHYELLVNNAGVGVVGDFAELPLKRLQSMMKLNLDALVQLAHAYVQTTREGDALINVSSALAFMPTPMMSVYAATKAFVTSFSESLWHEQRPRGVFVMALHPGVTGTNFHTRSGGDDQNRPPESITQTPEQVVDTAMAALSKRRTPTVISGVKNKLFTSMGRLMPRRYMVSMMGKGFQ
ncbi:SDR family NAD(P)-dependent oxidoreductase [Myxococcota bacterium]|nr:SDR family NAD(P)-dependent oxidoreductase [Myxococcota bacterium]MBU1534539.1 SDR family NAD(P)-dependent oxidoreductase [Myxococcota bacterium]